MKKIAWLLLIVLAPARNTGNNFVGVKEGECPWAVRVLKISGDGKTTLFTGSLIDPTWILTSASCCTQPETNQYTWKVLLSASCQSIATPSIEDKKTWGNDIGLVQLRTAVGGKNIHLAKLPKDRDDSVEELGQMGGYVPSGIAEASTKLAKPLEMPVYPSVICPAFHWLERVGHGFCAGNRHAAQITQSDLGAGFVIKTKPRVIGVVSEIMPRGILYSPVYMVKVWSHLDWLRKTMKSQHRSTGLPSDSA
ncbi:hypothetical protein CRM22_000839 [Opisthorchis felineus]|uniref:Peptidase S1 domain-containing protein n=1 Tax=Opisthorchis felineus TaxID=147828 RepID=A0A4V3SH31_OPIFE|nr:hypothetical protein CRM22_000839 [Opisthorchis felineus]